MHDFQLAASHAHLNLIGGVSLFLFGLYRRIVPDAGASALAKTQGWLHMTGAIAFPIGIALVREKSWSLRPSSFADRGRSRPAVRGYRVPDL
jgi:hypothetical protein